MITIICQKCSITFSPKANPNYLAQVVKIDNLRKHCNADRLQVTTIQGNNVITSLSAKEGFDLYIKDACDNLVKQLLFAIENKQNIVIDQTNLNVRSRKKKLKFIPKDYHKAAIYFSITLDESIQRNTRPGKTIPLNVIKSMSESIKLPTVEEGFDEVYSVDDFKTVHC